MMRLAKMRFLLLPLALLMLSLRALTPEGYMAAAPGNGLLFELCPEGVPAEVMQAITGKHHHHHGTDDGSESAQSSEQCPIGHMLSAAIAGDSDAADIAIAQQLPATLRHQSRLAQQLRTAYSSRAPPA